jgi:tRNA nucleotidyltransferase (CCA-adding enzyme)
MSWEHFAHPADMGVRGRGPTLAAAFEEVALAVTAVVTDPGKVEPRTAVNVECRGSSPEELLVEWLDAVVYEMATRRMLFGRFEVSIDGERLRARLWGEPVDRERHEPAVEVKGPTYTELRVAAEPGGWMAQCVVDV